MAEAAITNTLPETGVEEGTGFQNASFASVGNRTIELGSKSIEMLGTGIAKTSTSVIQPLLTSVLGANPLTDAVGSGIEGLGKLIGIGGKKVSNFVQNKQQIDNSRVAQQTDNSRVAQITSPVEPQPVTIQQSSTAGGSDQTDAASPLPSLLHPDMRRAARMPMVIRNAAMLSNAVQKKMEGDNNIEDNSEEQTDAILQAQEESSFRIVDALKDQTTMTLEKQEELQPSFLERRKETDMNRKALEEQKQTNKLLNEQNKEAKKNASDDSGGGGLIGGILKTFGGLSILKTFGAKLGSFIRPLLGALGKFPLILAAISAFEGLISGFDVFKKGGDFGEILRATLEGFLESIVNLVSFGFTDLETVRAKITDGIEWVANKFDGMWSSIVDFLDSTVQFLSFGFADIESVGNTISSLFDATKTVFGGIINFIGFQFGFLKDLFTGNFEGLFERVKTVFGFFMDGFKWIGDKVLGFFDAVIDGISTAFNFTPIGIAFNLIQKAFEFLPDVARKLFDSIEGIVRKIPGFGNKIADSLFGSEEPTQEELERKERTKEANERAANILDTFKQKEPGSSDLTVGDLERSQRFTGRFERSDQANQRPQRVSENIARTSTPQTTDITTPIFEQTRIQNTPESESNFIVDPLAPTNISAQERTQIASSIDRDAITQRANQRATQTENLSAQVREAQQVQQQQREQNTLNNMNQINNNQTTVTNPTKLPPRAEDFTAGAINRDQDY